MNSDQECLLTQDDVEVPELCACCAKRKYKTLRKQIIDHSWIYALVLLPWLLLWFRNELAFKAHGRRTQSSLHYRNGYFEVISALSLTNLVNRKKSFC